MYQIQSKINEAKHNLDQIHNLSEAIKHCDEVIKNSDCEKCKEEHRQLKEWLLVVMNLEKGALDKKNNDWYHLMKKVKEWSVERNLHTASPVKQMAKVKEEINELDMAIYDLTDTDNSFMRLGKEHYAEIIDGIGDSFVTLFILAQQLELDPIECLAAAWEEIKDREGQLINGTFIKKGDTRCVKCGYQGETTQVNGFWLCGGCAKDDDYMYLE